MAQGWHGARSSQQPNNPLVKKLLEARLAQGFTVQALAKKMGYSPNAIFEWEAERRSPTLRTLSDWAQALGFELNLMMRG